MRYLEILKKIVLVAERFQSLGKIDLLSVEIRVNTELPDSEALMYAFNVLEIPYQSYTPESKNLEGLSETNFVVGCDVDLRVLYYLTFIAGEIFKPRHEIYIIYPTEPEEMKRRIFFGSYVATDMRYAAISPRTTLRHVEILEKIVLVAERLQSLGKIDFLSAEIKINTELPDSEVLMCAFKVLEIPYQSYTPESKNLEDLYEANFVVGCEVDLRVLYYLSFIAGEVYKGCLDIYIMYATEPEEWRKRRIYFGSYIATDKNFTNISRPINPSEITALDIDNIDWERFSILFPNENYSDDGRCVLIREERKIDNFYNDRSHRDYDRDNFEALTDGQYGDYDDWRDGGGDFDTLNDRLGY